MVGPVTERWHVARADHLATHYAIRFLLFLDQKIHFLALEQRKQQPGGHRIVAVILFEDVDWSASLVAKDD